MVDVDAFLTVLSVMVAMDLVALPSHGTVEESHQDEVGRSKAKGGTTHFFTYCHCLCGGPGPPLYPGHVSCAGQAEHGLMCCVPCWHAWSPWACASSSCCSIGASTVCGSSKT